MTLSVDGGPPMPARRTALDRAIKSLTVCGVGRRVDLHRFAGVMSFGHSNGKIVVSLDGPAYEPLHVSLDDVVAIARVYHKSGQLHEGHSWRERDEPDDAEGPAAG